MPNNMNHLLLLPIIALFIGFSSQADDNRLSTCLNTASSAGIALTIRDTVKSVANGEHVAIGCCVNQDKTVPQWIGPEGNTVPNFFSNQLRRDIYFYNLHNDRMAYLIIPNFNSSFTGKYTCQSSDSNAEVTLQEINRVKIEAPDSVLLEIGKPGFIPCRVTGPPDNFHVTWFFKSKHLMESPNTYRLLNNSQVLEIQSVTPYTSSGQYLCKVEQEDPHHVEIRPITVHVYSPPFIATDSPNDGDKTHLEGESMVIKCSASGYPIPHIVWNKNGEEIVSDGEKVQVRSIYDNLVTNSTLTVNNLGVFDAGEYACVAQFISEKYNVNATAVRKKKPKMVFTPRVLPDTRMAERVKAGENASLRCAVIGGTSEHLTVVIMKDKTELLPNDLPPRYFMEAKEDGIVKVLTLRIEEVRSEDSNYFTCKGNTTFGDAREKGFLNVLFSPVVSAPQSAVLGIPHEQSVLSCKAKGSPEVSWTWEMNNEQVDTEGDLYRMEVTREGPGGQEFTSRLRVLPHKNSRPVYGTYTCRAQNTEGSGTALVTLNKAIRPPAPQVHVCKQQPRLLKFCLQLPNLETKSLPLTHMEIRYREAEDGRLYGYALPLSNEVIIPNLIPGRDYLFAISVVSAAGRSPSVILRQTTPHTTKPVIVLGSVSSVMSTSGTPNLPLKWSVNATDTSEVQDYVVWWRQVQPKNPQDPAAVQSDTRWQHTIVSTSDADNQSALLLKNLSPGVEYEVCIRARGKSLSSDTLCEFFRTAGAAALRPSSLLVLVATILGLWLMRWN